MATARLGERVIYILYQSEEASPTIPTNRKKEEYSKTVVYKKRSEQQLGQQKIIGPVLFKPASSTPSNTGSARSFHRDTEKGIKVP